MDKRRFIIAIVVLIAGVILLATLTSPPPDEKESAPSPQTQSVADTQPPTADSDQPKRPAPATAPTTTPSTRPSIATTRPRTATAPSKPVDTRPAISAGEVEKDTPPVRPEYLFWFDQATAPRLGGLQATPQTIGFAAPYRFRLQLDSRGAAIRTLHLAEYFQTAEQKHAYEDNAEKYNQQLSENPDATLGHYRLLSPPVENRPELMPLSTRALTVWVDGSDRPIVHAANLGKKNWKLLDVRRDDDVQAVTYELALYHDLNARRAGAPPKRVKMLAVRKTYTARKDDYSLDVTLRLLNYSGKKLRAAVEQIGPSGVPREDYRGDERRAVTAVLDEGRLQPAKRTIPDANKTLLGEGVNAGTSSAGQEPVVWVGYVNKFFGSMLYVHPRSDEQLNASTYDLKYQWTPVWSDQEESRTWVPGMQWRGIVLPSGSLDSPSETSMSIDLFAGPKDVELLKENPLYHRLMYVETIESRSCICPASWIGALRNGLMWLLGVFARHIFFGNFGLSIILLVGIVRLLLHPLTKYSQVSMSKMQSQMARLKPKMDKLKDKYKDDKQTLNQEMMKLYKEHGNPMSGMLGCLPMMLQIPIWVALFSGLNSQVMLRHAAFLPMWITDLAAPDALVSWTPFTLPIFGEISSFNLLPLLLCVSMYLQAKFNPSMSGANLSEEQAQQQKMMRFMMPAMMLLFFYKMPSGLNLYIMTSTFAAVCEMHVIRKHIRQREEAQAAGDVIVQAPGKSPRDNRPKKNKGPFWTKNR